MNAPQRLRAKAALVPELVEALEQIEKAANISEEISPGWLLGVVCPVLAKVKALEVKE